MRDARLDSFVSRSSPLGLGQDDLSMFPDPVPFYDPNPTDPDIVGGDYAPATPSPTDSGFPPETPAPPSHVGTPYETPWWVWVAGGVALWAFFKGPRRRR